MADPIHQFEINKIFTIGHVGGQEIAFTNSSLFMVIAVGIIARAADRHDDVRAAWCPGGCSRSRSSPTSSSPQRYEVPPAARE